MWEDEILDEIHRREEHAKSFNYDLKAICEDWRKKQAQSGRKFVTLSLEQHSNTALELKVKEPSVEIDKQSASALNPEISNR